MTEDSEHLFYAIKRGEKWVTKRMEDATEEDFRGLSFEREFMSAAVMTDNPDAALIQIETNIRAGVGPFDAIENSSASFAGLDLVKRLIREAGHRVSRL